MFRLEHFDILSDQNQHKNLCVYKRIGGALIFIYPDNLTAKPTLWLWELKDLAVVGVGLLLSVLALASSGFLLPLVLTVLYAFLSIRMEDASILDFLRNAVCFLFLHQQYYEWRARYE